MKSQTIISTIILALILVSCNPSRIISDYEKSTDFKQYKTFAMHEHGDNFPIGANPFNKQRIEQAIEKEMIGQGYQKSENADLAVSWFVKVDVHHYLDDHRDYYGRWRSENIREINWYEYKVGTLVIDLLDIKQNKAVWHGAISGNIEGLKKVEEKINKAVRDLFDRYQEEIGKSQEVEGVR